LTVELEKALRRYRPTGPPGELRTRVLGGESAGRSSQSDPVGRPFQGRPWREWLLPAAAAAAAIVFYVLASGVQRDVLRVEGSNDAREAAIAAIAIGLGGDDLARIHAERLMNLIENQPGGSRYSLAPLPGEVTP
jgi:hypothetical protein